MWVLMILVMLNDVWFYSCIVHFQTNTKKVKQSMSDPRMNEKITAKFVRLVLDEEHFIVSRREALERARKLDLDLVEVEAKADPPICKIMDFHKEKYKKQLREKKKLKIKSHKTL
ncbi:translation initiation factor IF3-1, mitochondrial-like isoform X2 [Malus domestica]|uniref:translation initiation factor IF3-1, mitochondrial-like isoform X2 n=1 Tax=Malus domestica TaxID=3750 RepID=UPI0039762BD9